MELTIFSNEPLRNFADFSSTDWCNIYILHYHLSKIAIYTFNSYMTITISLRYLLTKFAIIFWVVCQNSWFSFLDRFREFLVFYMIVWLNSRLFDRIRGVCFCDRLKKHGISFLMILDEIRIFMHSFDEYLWWFLRDRLTKITIATCCKIQGIFYNCLGDLKFFPR